MDTVLETPQEAVKGYTKKHISIPIREVEQMDKMSSYLCNHFGFTNSQLHRYLYRKEYKKLIVSL